MYLYILESIATGHWYIGTTDNTDFRLLQHNSGSVRSTKAYRPYRLIYQEQFSTVREARQRERLLKKSGRIRKSLKQKLSQHGPIV